MINPLTGDPLTEAQIAAARARFAGGRRHLDRRPRLRQRSAQPAGRPAGAVPRHRAARRRSGRREGASQPAPRPVVGLQLRPPDRHPRRGRCRHRPPDHAMTGRRCPAGPPYGPLSAEHARVRAFGYPNRQRGAQGFELVGGDHG